MTKAQTQVVDHALALPAELRAELAAQLLDSLGDTQQAGVDAAWTEEAERRLTDFESGKIKSIPAVEVFRSLLDRANRP